MKKIFLLLITLLFLISACNINSKNKNCNYENDTKKYIGKSQDECSRIRFVCEPSRQYFEDECGCGCELKEGKNEIAENYCTPEQKKADVCIELYKPVCGWFDSKQIQCIKYPCAATYSNSCFACANEKILYWTEGECPE